MKKKDFRSVVILVLSFLLVISIGFNVMMELNIKTMKNDVSVDDILTEWNDGEALSSLVDYVEDVTNPAGINFIPEVDRIAVFDLDGTICGEQLPSYTEWMMFVKRVLDDPSYTPTEKQIRMAGLVLQGSQEKSYGEEVERDGYYENGELFAGMSNEDYHAYVRDFIETDADAFSGLKLKDAFFRPMVQVVSYLKANGFTVYIVSGTDREAVRVMTENYLDLPERNIIGSDYYSVMSGQGDSEYLSYDYKKGDKVILDKKPLLKNVKTSKVVNIAQEIGRKPVMAFGNSTGDKSMFAYTLDDNKYKAIAFCLIPDDDEREVAMPKKVEKLKKMCKENGYHVISMKNDFKTMYGEGVSLNLDNHAWYESMMEKYNSKMKK